MNQENNAQSIAIIGMSGRFPGANDIDTYWSNIAQGKCSIKPISNDVIKQDKWLAKAALDPNYVKMTSEIDNVYMFDASFFDVSPREAEYTDPQRRLLLECAYETFENAGYIAENYDGIVGVYVGSALSNYFFQNLIYQNELGKSIGYLPLMIANDKDYASTYLSYKLKLTGPSLNINTACSTSLVAISQACKNLISYDCDMALAGGVRIAYPQSQGYLYQPGSIFSPDGYCYTFDARAKGTIFGDGLGLILLKRLEDALKDGDTIHAVIKGSAVNNDGDAKMGYTAPSVTGQIDVVAEALSIADISPETISYVEAHGTGTSLGDPIEVEALTQVYRVYTDKKGYCAIGSLKPNMGHLEAASGVASLIKVVEALKHQKIPPNIHYESPNPEIDFDNSPFYVNTTLQDWNKTETPLRGAASAFGIGGTNAHVILEQAPNIESIPYNRNYKVLLLSAKTKNSLDKMIENLSNHFANNPDINLSDAAYTLQVGRQSYSNRCVIVCENREEAINIFEKQKTEKIYKGKFNSTEPTLAFMFPGQGSQHVNMALDLYQNETVFRTTIQQCAKILQPYLNFDLCDLLYPGKNQDELEKSEILLQQTKYAQPALFTVEYALTVLWKSWGVIPDVMIGHSVGEYVAACIAGVFSLEEGLKLVAERGRLMQSLETGGMLSVSLNENELSMFIGQDCDLAAVNAPNSCVISGSKDAIDILELKLTSKKINSHRLHTSHAFHSYMMEPILFEFKKILTEINFQPPEIRFVSNVTGTWIRETEATDPDYWVRHLRGTVNFSSGIETLCQEPNPLLLEVGPGQTLSTLAHKHKYTSTVLSSCRHAKVSVSDQRFIMETIGRLWIVGLKPNWIALYPKSSCRRIPLPTYPFERQEYVIDLPEDIMDMFMEDEYSTKQVDITKWFYLPSWKQNHYIETAEPKKNNQEKDNWLIFMDNDGFGENLISTLDKNPHNIIQVKQGEYFSEFDSNMFLINPNSSEDYFSLCKNLISKDIIPQKIIHLWNITTKHNNKMTLETFELYQKSGFYSLLYLVQALNQHMIIENIQINVIANGTQVVTGDEQLIIEKSTLLGACKVIPQEYRNLTSRFIDIELSDDTADVVRENLAYQLMQEVKRDISEPIVAYRSFLRWTPTINKVFLKPTEEPSLSIRSGGVYMITGGLGVIGLILAEALARATKVKLILTGRSGLPARETWPEWLENHDEQEQTIQKIKMIQKLESLGSEVMICQVDSSDLKEMKKIVTNSESLWGPLSGVIHGAGVIGNCDIKDLNQAYCEERFSSKVKGLLVLEEILENKQLDFCLLLSSLSSLLGGLGYYAYSSANSFMDCFVYKQHQKKSKYWFSVNWDEWSYLSEELEKDSGIINLGIKPEEGQDAFYRLINTKNLPQIIISTRDMQSRIDRWIYFKATNEDKNIDNNKTTSLHERPELNVDYEVPENELEEKVASVWREIIGIDKIGRHDNFFELGGDSLLATQLTARLREKFHVEFSLQSLFESSTIAGITEQILEETLSSASEKDLDEILNSVEMTVKF